MQKERFIEIPALHQTALFKKQSVLEASALATPRPHLSALACFPPAICSRDSCHFPAEVTGRCQLIVPAGRALPQVTGGAYRDGPTRDCGLDVPVDMYFWLDFFHAGRKCGKVPQPPPMSAPPRLPDTPTAQTRQQVRNGGGRASRRVETQQRLILNKSARKAARV